MNISRFLNIINTSKPVLADFYAEWCIPCKQMDPALKEIKAEFKEAVRILKVNVDKYPFISDAYNIQNIPTIILFKKGKVVWKGQGVLTANELKEILAGQLL